MNSSPERAPGAWALCTAALLAAAPCAAKVSFTGYGSFNFVADSNLRIYAPPALLAGTPEGPARGRGFSTDAVGLFAATPVGEDADFMMDVSYRGIGGTVREIRVQYAYLETPLPWGLRLQAGKVTLPFGYFNSRRFYPFRRTELSAPLFHSAILGLPIADAGGVLSWRGAAGDLDFDARLFGVNGYGSVASSTGSFRNASLPGGLSMANNLGTSNNNRDVAVGGQVALSHGSAWESGVSYYRGAWDRSGERLLKMVGTHLHLAPGQFDILAEFVHIDVGGDEGMRAAFGSDDWSTNGGFLTVSGPAGSPLGRPLTAYARAELYDSAASDGTGGHEVLRSGAVGLSLKVNSWVTWKGECLWLDYRVPAVRAKTIQLMGYALSSGLVVTF